jgi:hypothetical protein
MFSLKTIGLLPFIILIINSPIIAQIQYFKDSNGIRLYPQSHQLYPRDNKDKAIVTIKGHVATYTIDEVELLVSKYFLDGSSQDSIYQQITTDSFHFKPVLEAGMYLYSFQVILKRSQTVLITQKIANNVVCGDAYIIAGQSNAMGVVNGLPSAGIEQDSLYQEYPSKGSNQIYSKTLGNMPQYNGINGNLTNYNPNSNYWLPASASGDFTGFVGIWGLKLQYLIQQEYQMPTCFINGAYGGTNIGQHQLGFNNNSNPYNLETLFGCLNYRIQQANLKGKIKGVIWYQGENQNTYTRAVTYQDSLNVLIDSWETYWGEFSNVYVVQIHTGCNYHGFGQIVREQQRSIQRPLNASSTIVPLTSCGIGARALALHDPYYDCHFLKAAYNEFANRLFQVIGRDFYHNNKCITSPNILRAYYTYNELVLEFDQDLADLPEGIEQFFEFYQNNQLLNNSLILNAYAEENKVHLLIKNQNPDALSYLLIDDPIYNNEMIWLKNPAGYSAFSFHQFPIETLPCNNSNFSIQSNLITNQNPLKIHLKSCQTNNKLSIYSVQGQLVFQKNLPFVNIETSLDLSHLAQGLYFLSVESDGHFLETQKIIKY